MTFKRLAEKLARMDGLKKGSDITQIRSILSNLSDLFYEDTVDLSTLLYDQGFERARNREKEAKKR